VAEPDILDLLDNATEGECCLFELAAAEIRRLRAALAGHASGDGKQQQRHGREEG
jgi:hypothetical protein